MRFKEGQWVRRIGPDNGGALRNGIYQIKRTLAHGALELVDAEPHGGFTFQEEQFAPAEPISVQPSPIPVDLENGIDPNVRVVKLKVYFKSSSTPWTFEGVTNMTTEGGLLRLTQNMRENSWFPLCDVFRIVELDRHG